MLKIELGDMQLPQRNYTDYPSYYLTLTFNLPLRLRHLRALLRLYNTPISRRGWNKPS
jgi:hypothetical protein